MPGLSKPQRDTVVPRIGLAVGGGSAGCLGTLAILHSPNAAAAIAFGVGTALASAIAALPSIIKARADACVARERTRQRTLLIEAGLAHNPDFAMSLLRIQPFDADVVLDPRCGDALLRALMPDPRAPCEPAS